MESVRHLCGAGMRPGQRRGVRARAGAASSERPATMSSTEPVSASMSIVPYVWPLLRAKSSMRTLVAALRSTGGRVTPRTVLRQVDGLRGMPMYPAIRDPFSALTSTRILSSRDLAAVVTLEYGSASPSMRSVNTLRPHSGFRQRNFLALRDNVTRREWTGRDISVRTYSEWTEPLRLPHDGQGHVPRVGRAVTDTDDSPMVQLSM